MRTLIPLPPISGRFIILLPFVRAVMSMALIVVVLLPFIFVMPLFLVPALMLLMRAMGINGMLMFFQMKGLLVNAVRVVVIGIQRSMVMVGCMPPVK